MHLARKRVAFATICLAALWSGYAFAQSSDVDALIVTGGREVALDTTTPTGSRLGLEVREIPAQVDVLTQERFLERGLRTSNEALNSAPGITAFNAAGAPGTLTMRGFGGQNVSVAYDGVHLTNTTMTNRDLDGFAFDRIEVLKGPSSVLYGEGALGGTVNYVTKKPMLGSRQVQVLGTYGSLDTYRAAGDVNLPIGDSLAVRAVVSAQGTDGFVDRAGNRLFTANLGLAWRPTSRFSNVLSVEYARNRTPAPYWGTPLVPAAVARHVTDIVSTPDNRVLDRMFKDANFQYLDSYDKAYSLWLRAHTEWSINDQWKLTNDLSYNTGVRIWRDNWAFAYVPASRTVNRSADFIKNTYYFYNERLSLSSDTNIGGHRNRFSLGGEFNTMDHLAVRRFGPAIGIDAWAPVNDPSSPVLGRFPALTQANFPGGGNYVDLGMVIKTEAAFAEDAFNLTDKWLIVGGARVERLKLDQDLIDYNLRTTTGFRKTYKPFSYRIGTVYSLTKQAQIYGQYSRAAAPVSSLTLLQASNSGYKLTQGKSLEGGVKASFFNNRVETTASGFWIRQSDIITRDPVNPAITIQGGTQSSRGVEVSVTAAVTHQLRLDANYAYVDARFDELIEAGGANRTGNKPPNIPASIFNAFASYRLAGAPVTFTAGVRTVSRVFADNANTVRLRGYTVADASIGYTLPFGDVTLRVRNIGDSLYAVNGGTQSVYLAAPRTVDITFRGKF